MALERGFGSPPQEAAFEPSEVTAGSFFFVAGTMHNSLVLKAKEPGFAFVYNAKFNLLSNTAVALKITDPHGRESIIDSLRLSTPAVEIDTGLTGMPTVEAGEYIQFTTNSIDFYGSGVWKAEGLYIDLVSQRSGDAVYFVVGDSFYG